MTSKLELVPKRSWPAWTVALTPFAIALLGPVLPLLIVFAGTLPLSAPHVGKAFAALLAWVLALALATSLVGLAFRGVRSFPAELWLPLAAFVATQAIALIFAVHPAAGVFGIATLLGGVITLVACSEALSNTRLRRAFLACYFISASLAVSFAIELSIMRQPPEMFAYEHGRASGTFLQPNEFAGYLLFLIPLGFAQVAAPRWLRLVGLLSAGVGTAGLLFSVSRAAMISFILGLGIFVRRFGRRAVLAYVFAAAIALAVMGTAFRDVAHDPSENASRAAVWAGAVRLVQRFALTGVGPFGFHLAYPALKRPEAAAEELHAHDLPLQILIEDGVLGLAALAWFVLAAARAAARAGSGIAPGDREQLLLFAALGAGFTASALQNLVDVVTTFLLIVSWPMLGLLLASARQERTGPCPRG